MVFTLSSLLVCFISAPLPTFLLNFPAILLWFSAYPLHSPHSHSDSHIPTLIPHIPTSISTLIPRIPLIPTLIPPISTPIPHAAFILTPIYRILIIPFTDSPF